MQTDAAADFAHVTTWVFDLDDTLYPPALGLFAAVQARMTRAVMTRLGVGEAEAQALRRGWLKTHGTTLAGMMAEHGTEPWAFLDEVHAIDLSAVRPDPALAAAIAALPGEKIVHTSADAAHAGRVLARLGLGVFDAIYGIGETGFVPKPDARSYAAVLAAQGFDPRRAAFFEDSAANLDVPHSLGMRTVLVAPADAAKPPAPHVGHRTADLAAFLRALVG